MQVLAQCQAATGDKQPITLTPQTHVMSGSVEYTAPSAGNVVVLQVRRADVPPVCQSFSCFGYQYVMVQLLSPSLSRWLVSWCESAYPEPARHVALPLASIPAPLSQTGIPNRRRPSCAHQAPDQAFALNRTTVSYVMLQCCVLLASHLEASRGHSWPSSVVHFLDVLLHRGPYRTRNNCISSQLQPQVQPSGCHPS
jgi:hypothetical protein